MIKELNKGLVSIITPCYNTGRYINRLLDSVLNQTYSNIEMFVIDDGSTDDSKDVITSYIPLFEKKGYSLTYVYQENSGQSVAINNGLKLVKGEFLAWPDSDDFYASNDAIFKMVERLESSSAEFALVRCQMYLLDEEKLTIVGRRGENAKIEEEWNLFEECLRGNTYLYPGCYMVRLSCFWEVNGSDIYTEKDAGQNWQMFLPVLYKYRCTTIKEYLFNVIARSASHSRGQYKGIERTIQKWNAYERTLLATVDKIASMPQEKKDAYKKEIRYQYLNRRFELSVRNNNIYHAREYYQQMLNCKMVNTKQRFLYFCAYIPGLFNFITKVHVKLYKAVRYE